MADSDNDDDGDSVEVVAQNKSRAPRARKVRLTGAGLFSEPAAVTQTVPGGPNLSVDEKVRGIVEGSNVRTNGNAPSQSLDELLAAVPPILYAREKRKLDIAFPSAPPPEPTLERHVAEEPAAVENNKDNYVNLSKMTEPARVVDISAAIDTYYDCHDMLMQQVNAIDVTNTHFYTARDPDTGTTHGFIIKTETLKQSCDAILQGDEIQLVSRCSGLKSPQKFFASTRLFAFLANSLHPNHDAHVLKVFREIADHCQKYMNPIMYFLSAGAVNIHLLFRTLTDEKFCFNNVYVKYKQFHPEFPHSKEEIERIYSHNLSHRKISGMTVSDLIWCPANQAAMESIVYIDVARICQGLARSSYSRIVINPVFGCIGPVEATRMTTQSASTNNNNALDKEKQ
jgi:hypothetical protein